MRVRSCAGEARSTLLEVLEVYRAGGPDATPSTPTRDARPAPSIRPSRHARLRPYLSLLDRKMPKEDAGWGELLARSLACVRRH
eukprot:5111968-Pleurochrysis_carterae.AAC.1